MRNTKRRVATHLALTLILVTTPLIAPAEEPDSQRDSLGQGGVTVISSEGTQNVLVENSEETTQVLAPIAQSDALLYLVLGVQFQGGQLAAELGFDPNEFADKFAAASPELQQAGFRALLLESEINGSGLLGTLTVLAFTDPVYAFDFVYTNTSDVEQTVEYQMPLNTDPTPFVNEVTPIRSYLEVDLLDGNDDGQASLGFAPGSAGGFLRTDVTIDGFDSAILIDDQGDGLFDLGEELPAPTTNTQIFDTGLASLRTFASDPEFITDIGPALRFTISPGDEARLRGVITVADSAGLLADPLLALNLLDNGFGSLVPEPTAVLMSMLGLVALAESQHRR